MPILPPPADHPGVPAAVPRPPRGPARRFSRLRRDESGGLIIFALFCFIIMLTISGLAIDLMRTETARTKLQTTLDRAVLAASDMDQLLDPEEVVRDYMVKAGLDPYLVNVTVIDTAANRIVSAEANAEVRMFFANLVGIDRLPAPAIATAAEAVSNLEVSLVVDVSGSMGGAKIAELKTAAISFANILLTTMGPERVSINIVPYSTQVAVPAGLLDLLSGFERDHPYSNCLSFSASDFNSVPIRLDPAPPQAAHFDPFYTWGPLRPPGTQAFVCNPNSWAELVLEQNDMGQITSYINAMQAGGNTSIDVGLKWGAALLDPTMGPIIGEFLGDPGTNPVAAYDDRETDKIVVLMTDGVNTTEYRLNGIDPAALSDIWYDDARNEFWVREDDSFDADGDGRYGSDDWFNPRMRMNGTSNFWRRDSEWPHGSGTVSENVRQLTYGELYDRVSLYYNAYYHHYIQEYRYDDWYGWYYGAMDTNLGNGRKNARLSDICDATKDNGVQIYSVGFEVNDSAALVMADCASSDSHFFRVAGSDLTTTFEQIAPTITELRLTQ